jgi:sn-glycerol 3-phosphate transport system permease protein
MKYEKYVLPALRHVALILISLIVVFPILIMISNSLKLPDDIFVKRINLIPHNPTFSNYVEAWTDYDVPIWFWNSIGTSLGITTLQLAICILASFAIVFFKFRGRSLIFTFFVASMLVPFQVTMIPNYILISKMGILNTWIAVILPNLANAFGVFLLRQHFRSFPYSLYEAAVLEGSNSLQILWTIVIPVCKAFIFALLILFFIDAWNLYFWPLLVMHTPESKTLSIGLQQFIDYELGHRWGQFMATSTLACLPTMIIYIAMQKQIIATYARSGLKG